MSKFDTMTLNDKGENKKMDFVTGSCEAKDMEFSDLMQAEDNSIVKTDRKSVV